MLRTFFLVIALVASSRGLTGADAPRPAGTVSPAEPLAAALVPMVGQVTDRSAELRVVLSLRPADPVSVMLERADAETPPRELTPTATHDSGRVVVFALADLSADTAYRYRITVGTVTLPGSVGTFRTFPSVGKPATFSFVVGCGVHPQDLDSYSVFTAAQRNNPLFYLNHGDLIYSNITQNQPDLFRAAFRRPLALPTHAALLRSTAFAYIWDDHDSGPNNCDRTAPGYPAARQVYREVFPHYPLAAGDGNQPIQQTFEVGRALFILTDLRSERDPSRQPDDENKSMLGRAQRAWLEQTLLAASRKYAVIFWVSSVPFLSPAKAGGDDWGGYTTERAAVLSFVQRHQIRNLVMLCGDAHMLAADDGRGTAAYVPDGVPVPVFQCGPLGSNGSFKGGPVYSHGHFVPPIPDGPACFALLTLRDSGPGEPVTVVYSGRSQDDVEKVACTITVPAAPPAASPATGDHAAPSAFPAR